MLTPEITEYDCFLKQKGLMFRQSREADVTISAILPLRSREREREEKRESMRGERQAEQWLGGIEKGGVRIH